MNERLDQPENQPPLIGFLTIGNDEIIDVKKADMRNSSQKGFSPVAVIIKQQSTDDSELGSRIVTESELHKAQSWFLEQSSENFSQEDFVRMYGIGRSLMKIVEVFNPIEPLY